MLAYKYQSYLLYHNMILLDPTCNPYNWSPISWDANKMNIYLSSHSMGCCIRSWIL